MGTRGRNSTAAFLLGLSRRALRSHVRGTSPCLTCVPGERSLLWSLPGFQASSSFSRRRGLGPGSWKVGKRLWLRVSMGWAVPVSAAGARQVDSKAFLASWSLQDLPLKWGGSFILSEWGSHCWYDTDSPERPRPMERAPTPGGAKGEIARGVSEAVSFEWNVTCVKCGMETTLAEHEKWDSKTRKRPSENLPTC